MEECLFCKIISGKIPANIEYSNDDVIAFNDISPKAPIHILVVPRIHFATVHEADDQQILLMAKLFGAVRAIVKQKKLVENGYRLVINSGSDAGQAVPHLHIHILAGRTLCWPPG